MPTALLLASWLVVTATAPPAPPRFGLAAIAVEPAAATDATRRIAVRATATLGPDAHEHSVRFALKSALVDCNPTPPDLLLTDGFEN